MPARLNREGQHLDNPAKFLHIALVLISELPALTAGLSVPSIFMIERAFGVVRALTTEAPHA
jgi:hypothetical protein